MKMRLIGQYFTFVVIALALVGLVGCASSDNRSNSNDEYLVYADSSGLILEGYDPVAFFTEAKAVKGSPTHKLTHQGATYHFASAANRSAFSENPEKYKPQFGGHCAMSMAMGMLEPTQIDTWSIINGRLVLQRNQKAVKMWSMDKQGNLIKADDNWPKILKKKGKKG